ncbi:DUF3995 domain-containing protein [Paenibacillus sp. TRM 82003]|nr:DUF3995 domain-containing protein [Paenibacillus sp. TRM 82003]
MAGGNRWVSAVIPSKGMEAERLFQPTKLETGSVAAALALAGWFVLELAGVIERVLYPEWLIVYGGWALSAVFIIRSIGDFRWLGFFKSKQGTLFAKMDTLLYSPLCLLIGIGVIILING